MGLRQKREADKAAYRQRAQTAAASAGNNFKAAVNALDPELFVDAKTDLTICLKFHSLNLNCDGIMQALIDFCKLPFFLPYDCRA